MTNFTTRLKNMYVDNSARVKVNTFLPIGLTCRQEFGEVIIFILFFLIFTSIF